MASLLEETARRLGDISNNDTMQDIYYRVTMQDISYRNTLGDDNNKMEKEQYYDSTDSRKILNTTYPNRKFEDMLYRDEYLNPRHTELTSEVPAYQEPYNNKYRSQTQQMQSQESPELLMKDKECFSRGPIEEECLSRGPIDLSVKKQDSGPPLHTQAHNMPRIFFSVN